MFRNGIRVATALGVTNVCLLSAAVAILVFYTRTGRNISTRTPSDVIDAQLHALFVETDSGSIYPRGLAASPDVEGSLGEAAAHLVIDPRTNYTVPGPTDTDPVLNWRDDINNTFVGNNVGHDDGSLTVTHGGYYFIYSQILYRGEGVRELACGRVLHTVLKQRMAELGEAPTPLLRNLLSTPSIRRGHLTYLSSTLGATFYLDPHTRLTVQSSVPGNIDTWGSPLSNVFGLFLV
ncbi:tumor necrosis factor ligand superfamily member 15-like isoform X1 [Haliotis rufescens]|uniref:tumor necrosis factor ligand superfamily member 15-like isoform X1 n=1 Tax=Haliotis rufescens TaxID=6454 RepID=UPI00201F0B10|nr:tumor necrosis factor ligand superfamily member 15-like isoform X1 [Haliotis rufescens]XP_046358719.2 tumor necrosis factor ligand superfamily member 15-like isoform X1 [Haliotis rufescens]